MDRRLVGISKFLSYVLRHDPASEDLSMDEHGWVVVEALLLTRGAQRRGLTPAMLAMVVAENDKQRFELDDTGQRIRARQGHSISVESDWTSVVPPEHLYHGTGAPAVSHIREEGLLKRNRQHVHLSLDAATARRVGTRHGKPVVLRIRAREMHETGHVFFVSGNGVWLTESVPPQFIDFP